MIRNWKAVFGVLLIFVLGFTSGIICSSIFVHRKMVAFLQHPAQGTVAAVEARLTRNLGLDANQKQQVHGYFMENLQERLQLNAQIRPQVQQLNQKTLQEITTVLRPDQQAQLAKNIEQIRTRFGNPNGEIPSSAAGAPGTR